MNHSIDQFNRKALDAKKAFEIKNKKDYGLIRPIIASCNVKDHIKIIMDVINDYSDTCQTVRLIYHPPGITTTVARNILEQIIKDGWTASIESNPIVEVDDFKIIVSNVNTTFDVKYETYVDIISKLPVYHGADAKRLPNKDKLRLVKIQLADIFNDAKVLLAPKLVTMDAYLDDFVRDFNRK